MVIFDVLGIGFGPANIAVAAANEELGSNLRMHFFEKNKTSSWQAGMQFGQSDIQNHPLRDLVTPRNPRSKYSFTNFLHTKGRLFEFLNLGRIFPLRTEYSQYVEWVAGHFADSVSYETEVKSIECLHVDGKPIYKVVTSNDSVHFGRSIIVAPGRTAYIPMPFAGLSAPNVIHLNQFIPTLNRMRQEQALQKIAVIGSSQSAVEIMLHLAGELPDAELYGFSRSFGYRMKDVSPFTGEVYFPEFVDTYYACSSEQKRALNRDLRFTNYSATDADMLDALYLKMYQEKIGGRERIFIVRSSTITDASLLENGKVSISYSSVESPLTQNEFDLVILATGFKNLGPNPDEERFPVILTSLVDFAVKDEDGVLKINKDYSLEMNANSEEMAPCYLNGLCESSHGMGDAGSFSILSLRSEIIVKSLSERLAAQASACATELALA